MKTLKTLTTLATAMFAAGMILPYIAGASLSPTAYTVLQLGGLGGSVIFGVPYYLGRRSRAV